MSTTATINYMACSLDNPATIVRREFGELLPEDRRDAIDDVPLVELGIDSLDFFERILYLEEEFGISIPVEDLDDKVTLADILKQVES